MKLTPNERKVLRMRFALERPVHVQTSAKETLQTIGDDIGVSITCIQKIEKRALKKLQISNSDYLYRRNEVLKIVEKI
jgi:DNA-directed RNA polymerase sigma subunit (sigma70/sigma32)